MDILAISSVKMLMFFYCIYISYNGLYSVHQYEIVKATKLVIRNKLRNRLGDIPAV